MTDYYVNKSGSDSNTGLDENNAFLTISAAINTAASSGDSIIVGAGEYKEGEISIGKIITFYADGIVFLNGNGHYSYAFDLSNCIEVTSLVENGDPIGKWIFKNYIGPYIIVGSSNSNFSSVTSIKYCTFISNSNQYGFYTHTGGHRPFLFDKCIFSGFTSCGIYIGSYSQLRTIRNCTFYNCPVAIYSKVATTSHTHTIQNNIFLNCNYSYNIDNDVNVDLRQINNNQYFGVNYWKIYTTTWTSLDDVKTAGLDNDSIIEDPEFLDPVNNIFYKKIPSTVIGHERTIGAIPFGYTTGTANTNDTTWDVGSTADNTKWYSPDSNIAKNATTGNLELISGITGTIYSPVYDLGLAQTINAVNLAVDQTWPTAMIDTTNTDTKPNKQTIEIRASMLSFDQDAVSPNWVEINTEFPISPITGRYVQLRLTFRSNGVEA